MEIRRRCFLRFENTRTRGDVDYAAFDRLARSKEPRALTAPGSRRKCRQSLPTREGELCVSLEACDG